ncbi:hydrogenase 4 subunit B [Beijerinckia indica]|uniref:NADH dehydrogenase (Quinone) n=1 Tax=Beijerinckia indica subsp. indica (strain ATCC 9039 / DSM 1715 / NCIMB 8712) TaxID=395963 RepID=B2IIC9_BEII9|nr:hydrogenase 4 subunit B [Beijerinckia indica]ACB96082.1 NADH dehydrogenase (quinone) [Beijerinckia indica subsp. indica ATCC 9039]
MAATFTLLCVGIFLSIAVLAVLIGQTRNSTPAIYGGCLMISLLALAGGIISLLTGAAGTEVVLPLGLPWIGAHFRIDPLAGFFLAVVNLGGAAASLYGIGYGRHEHEPSRVLPFFPAFLAGMNLVVMADDAFTFLFSWEFMSLSSWALVMAHHGERENARAGLVYLIMASFGTLVLLLAFGLLAGPDGFYAFTAIRTHHLSQLQAGTVLVLALLGTGSKAGLVPLHVWLPLAHPAAPSHVSALMSGVMTKVAVYAFIRIAFDLLGPPDWWWSVPVLVMSGGSAVLGVLYAMMQDDLKRVLAYSTIENIGIIFVTLGLALTFEANGLHAAGALALTAGLFHVLNHALFKSVLFFGAGAVLVSTGLRRMDHLGGLINPMPVTSILVLVACAAISALPPLNGFVSEWLAFQAILLSPQLPQWGLRLLVPAVGALLALSAALAAACFVRVFGIVFLGRPRTPAAQQAREVDLWSQSAMAVLASLCLLAGILPGFIIDSIAPSVYSLIKARMPVQGQIQWLSIVPVAESRSSYNGLLVFIFSAVSAALAAFIIHRFASRATRRAPIWDCGFPDPSPATQYSAESFAQPIRRVFGTPVFRAREQVEMPEPGNLAPARIIVTLHDPAWEALYTPITNAVSFVARQLDRLQFLTIRHYLGFVFFALVTLLMVLALWP